jgi:hypothetical protein
VYLFLSYAREQSTLAQTLADRLEADGRRVFIDTKSLPLAQPFDAAVRKAIDSCDLFVFLISPDSVSPGYALSELRRARQRWRNPRNRILPVQIVPTTALPPELASLMVLFPVGDTAADVLAAVDGIRRMRIRQQLRIGALGGGVAAVVAVAASLMTVGAASSWVTPDGGTSDGSVLELAALQPPIDAAPRRDVQAVRTTKIRRYKRFFPHVQRCRVSLTRAAHGWTANCHCPEDVSAHAPQVFAERTLPEDDSLWQRAARFLKEVEWVCP